jgi:hypothetical protein
VVARNRAALVFGKREAVYFCHNGGAFGRWEMILDNQAG